MTLFKAPLFKSSLFRSFAFGFLAGGVGICLVLGVTEGNIGSMVPQAIAGTVEPGQGH